MAEESSAIVTETTDCIAIVRFNQPAERNPLPVATLHELRVALSALIKDEELNTIIFTGTDDVFASGANIRELAQLDSRSALEFARLGQALCQTIADARPLTIAAITGY